MNNSGRLMNALDIINPNQTPQEALIALGDHLINVANAQHGTPPVWAGKLSEALDAITDPGVELERFHIKITLEENSAGQKSYAIRSTTGIGGVRYRLPGTLDKDEAFRIAAIIEDIAKTERTIGYNKGRSEVEEAVRYAASLTGNFSKK